MLIHASFSTPKSEIAIGKTLKHATWRRMPIMHLRDGFCSVDNDVTKVPPYFDNEYVREITRERLKFTMFLKTVANNSNNTIILTTTIIEACNDI